jgi:hypothetical protein
LDVESHQASPFADTFQAEVMFFLKFDIVKGVDEVGWAFPNTELMVLMRQF